MNRLLVELGSDRDRCGGVSLFDASGKKICGPFAVAARSTDTLAAANGNPERDPLLRFGDTPTGGYMVRRLLKSGNGTKFSASQFGPHGLIVIESVSGNAACAEANGRFNFAIAGGDLSAGGQLRSTAGSLRLSNEEQRKLFAALQKRPNVYCEIVECDHLPNRGAVFVDLACKYSDPLALPRHEAAAKPRAAGREVLRGTAASAMMLGFTVSFVAAQGAEPAHASVAATPGSLSARRDDKFVPPVVLPDGHYTRLAYGTSEHPNKALEQLQNAIGQPTGKTFDNATSPLPSDATPTGGTVVPPAPSGPTGGQNPSQPNAAGGQNPPQTQTPPADQNNAVWQRYLEQQKNEKTGVESPAWQHYIQQQKQQGLSVPPPPVQAAPAPPPPPPPPKQHVPGPAEVKPSTGNSGGTS